MASDLKPKSVKVVVATAASINKPWLLSVLQPVQLLPSLSTPKGSESGVRTSTQAYLEVPTASRGHLSSVSALPLKKTRLLPAPPPPSFLFLVVSAIAAKHWVIYRKHLLQSANTQPRLSRIEWLAILLQRKLN